MDDVIDYATPEFRKSRQKLFRRWLIVAAIAITVVLCVLVFLYTVPFGPPWDPPKRMDQP